MKVIVIALVLMAGGISSGNAQELSDQDVFDRAQKLYVAGEFVAAGDLARQVESVEAKVLAAKAYLAEAGYVRLGVNAADVLEAGLAVTAQAIAADPDYVEAILYRVIAIGYLSRTRGNWGAHNEGLGRDAEVLVKRAIELEPRNPWALMALGGWHSEIVDGAGSFLASIMYGASNKKAIKACEDALLEDSLHIVFNVECARTLFRISSRKHGATAIRMLKTALEGTPAGRFEELVQNQGRQLIAAYETGDKTKFKTLFRQLDAFRQ
jgi:hypothetical protein